jgi:single-stranded-DNA-specific exonuclease
MNTWNPRTWEVRRPARPGPAPWGSLAAAWDLDSRLARLAWMRGIDAPEELAWRLDPNWGRSSDPYALEGVGSALKVIRDAVAEGRRICVYGDYDVDGVTATALMVRVLERVGAKVGFFIPNRFSDGYGLNLECIRELKAMADPSLLLSVDCGIRSAAEVAASREMGLEWIITDHHALGSGLPEARAVVHPGLGGYPNPNLSGVGVAFKLAQALLDVRTPVGEDATFLDGLLKLVAIGTIADMVPLHGENALLVKRGLRALGKSNGPGLMALLSAAKAGPTPGAMDIAFGVGPRLNAVGRMGGAEDAVRLLLTRDPKEAAVLMERVERLNADRKMVQQELVRTLPPPSMDGFDLVVDPAAHKGVIGIVAGQRMRVSGRPSAVCTVLDGVAQCSLRAPEGYDLGVLLELARPYLLSGGGHRLAAGMSFRLSQVDFVRRTLARGAADQAGLQAGGTTLVDGLGTADIPGAGALETLEPWGQGFPWPVAAIEGRLSKAPEVFGGNHARLRMDSMAEPLTWFSAGDLSQRFSKGQKVAFAAAPQDHPRWGRSWVVEGPLELQES